MRYNVKAAARATGLSASRLRTWERRYGIPRPDRATSGRRLYDEEDLAVIRRMAALVDAGLSAAEAARAAASGEAAPPGAAPAHEPDPRVERLVAAAAAFDAPALNALLHDAVAALGWAAAVEAVLFPALREIGRDWEAAALPVAVEHFCSELVRRAVAAALVALPPTPAGAPRILLACPEGEHHTLGLEVFALLLRGQGIDALSLGADLPVPDLLVALDAVRPNALCVAATGAGGLASLARMARIIAGSRNIPLFVGGPALLSSTVEVAGVRLPQSLDGAAQVIARRVSA